MPLDREFLDIFWNLSAETEPSRNQTCEKIINAIKSKPDSEKQVYIDYTGERLIKGLRSFDQNARLGFEMCLPLFLNTFKLEFQTSQVVKAMLLHVYGAETVTKKENSTVKYAYISCAKVLCSTGRLKDMECHNLKNIIFPIVSIVKKPAHADSAYLMLSNIIKIVNKRHLDDLLDEFLKTVFSSSISNPSQCSGGFILFVLTSQKFLKKRLSALSIQPIQFVKKKYKKMLLRGIKDSSVEISSALLDEIITQDMFTSLWPEICELLIGGSPRDKFHLTQLSVHVVCNHSEAISQTILTSDVVNVISSQLSGINSRFFKHVCYLIHSLLSTVTSNCEKTTVSNEISADCPNIMSPSTLLIMFLPVPLNDFDCHPSAPKICQTLLQSVPSSLTINALSMYASKLMNEFVEAGSKVTPDTENVESVNKTKVFDISRERRPELVRRFIVKTLSSVIRCSLTSSDSHSDKLLKEVLKFLLVSGLKQSSDSTDSVLKTPISTNTSRYCWQTIFSIVERLFKNYAYSSNEKTTREIRIFDLVKLIRKLLKVCSKRFSLITNNELWENILPSVNHCIKFLNEAQHEDYLDLCLLMLCGVGCLVAFSEPSEDIFGLLNDLIECWNRRHKKNYIDQDNDYTWPAVLTDVILGLLSRPILLLRCVIRQVFQNMLTMGVFSTLSSEEKFNCMNLITDLMKTRPIIPASHRKGDLGEPLEDEDKLIEFSYGNSKIETLLKVIENDSHVKTIDQESESDSASMDEDDGNVSLDTSSDSGNEEEINVDEASLNNLRENVRKALGPAALVSDEIDKEFDDADMFAREEALVAAFRANRLVAPHKTAAQQARSLKELKMRCMDLLQCIIQYSSEPSLLLSTLKLLLEISKDALLCEQEFERKKRNSHNRDKIMFLARHGDTIPLSQIISALNLLNSRHSEKQKEFLDALHDTTHHSHLIDLIELAINLAQTPDPSPKFVKILSTTIQFIYRSVSSLRDKFPNVESKMTGFFLKQLDVTLHDARHAPIQPYVYIFLLKDCPALANISLEIITSKISCAIEKLIEQIDNPTQLNTISGSQSYSMVHLFHLAQKLYNGVPSNMVKTEGFMESLIKLSYNSVNLLRKSISSIPYSSEPSVWFNRTSIPVVLFEILRYVIKLNVDALLPFQEPELIDFVKNFPSTNKTTKRVARKFACFIEERNRNKDMKIKTTTNKKKKSKSKKKLRKQKPKSQSVLQPNSQAASITNDVQTMLNSRFPSAINKNRTNKTFKNLTNGTLKSNTSKFVYQGKRAVENPNSKSDGNHLAKKVRLD